MHCTTSETGIYQLRNVENGFTYIGSAAGKGGFRKRLEGHKSLLKHERHHSYLLQSDWNKYGQAAFVFEIVFLCEPSQCRKIEQTFLDAKGIGAKNKSYNVCDQASGGVRGRIVSQETRRKIGQGRTRHKCLIISPDGTKYKTESLVATREFKTRLGVLCRKYRPHPTPSTHRKAKYTTHIHPAQFKL